MKIRMKLISSYLKVKQLKISTFLSLGVLGPKTPKPQTNEPILIFKSDG
jgi:hypothetical protein